MELGLRVNSRRQVKLTNRKRYRPPLVNYRRTPFPRSGKLLTLYLIVVTQQYSLLVFLVQMHRPTKAIPKHLAISALSCLHPLTVTERLETVFPNIQKIILIDVALRKAAIDVGTGRNGTVNKDGANGDARAAEIEPVADFALVRTNVGLATELAVNLAFLSCRDNEVH